MWNVDTKEEIRQFKVTQGKFEKMILSENGKLLFSTDDEFSIFMWNTETGEQIYKF